MKKYRKYSAQKRLIPYAGSRSALPITASPNPLIADKQRRTITARYAVRILSGVFEVPVFGVTAKGLRLFVSHAANDDVTDMKAKS